MKSHLHTADPIEQVLELSRSHEHDDSYDLDVNIKANCLNRPSTIITLPLRKRTGIYWQLDLVQMAIRFGVLQQHGAHVYLDGLRRAGSRVEMAMLVSGDEGLQATLEARVLSPAIGGVR